MSEENEQSVEALTKKIADLEAEKANLVGELKDDRQKRQQKDDEIATLQQALEEATKKNLNAADPNDVTKVVADMLAERDASMAKSNKIAAIEKFVADHKEFHPDTDTTGKRREALVEALKRFNTDGLKTVDEFYAVIRDAHRLLVPDTGTQPSGEEEQPNPYSSTPSPSITPKVAEDKEVTPEEKKLYEKNGWTKERYIELRAKNPTYMANLLKLAQS